MSFVKPPLRYIALTDEKIDKLIEFLNFHASAGDPDAYGLCSDIYSQQHHNPADEPPKLT